MNEFEQMIRNNYNLTLEDFVNILDAWAKLGDKDRDKVIILAEERKAHPTIYMPSEEYVEDDEEELDRQRHLRTEALVEVFSEEEQDG